jgi:hypothetical protein
LPMNRRSCRQSLPRPPLVFIVHHSESCVASRFPRPLVARRRNSSHARSQLRR